MNESNNNEKLNYETPETLKTRVKLETPFMAASKEKVVTTQDNTNVTIKAHQNGGDFTLNEWNEQ